MQFNLEEWRKIYDEIQVKGKIYKDSLPSYDEELNKFPPISPLSESDQKKLFHEIDDLKLKNDLYLDACGIRSNPPLWNFSIDDPTTWKSHRTFAYKHLVNNYRWGRR